MFTTASPLSARRLRRLLSLILLPAVVLSLFVPHTSEARAQAAPQRFVLTDLGPNAAYDINDQGLIVGGSGAVTPARSAIRWQGDIVTELVPAFSMARVINEHGDVLGIYGRDIFDNQAFLLRGGTFYPLSSVDGYSSISVASMNDAGQVVGSVQGEYVAQPAVIEPNAVQILPIGEFEDKGGFAAAINNRGQIAGNTYDANYKLRATLWSGGSPTFLDAFGIIESQANAINEATDIVGSATLQDQRRRAFVWRGGQFTNLSGLADEYDSEALALNNDGVIVGRTYVASDVSRAVAWYDDRPVDLNTLIPSDSGIVLEAAVSINNLGQIVAQGRRNDVEHSFLLTPAREVSIESLTLQRQERESTAWVDLPPAGQVANLPDGSPARLVARLRNSGSAPVTIELLFRNTTTDRPLSSCPPTATVTPTGSGPAHEVHCTLPTAGLAFADGDPASPGTVHSLELKLTLPDASSQTSTRELHVRPRPIVLVPGIAGNYSATVGGPSGNKLDMPWLMNRGVDPVMLAIDPLARSYDGLLQTLVNSGWSRNRTLRIANYDWRLVPGPSDGVYDGVVQGLTAETLADTSYRYGVDYLGRTLRELDEFWRDEYGVPLDAVDVIAHSTGGLVTRTYLQSTAYGGVYNSATGARLPRVTNFFSVGVPHRGASKAWNPLHDNWVIDESFQVVLSKIANRAFQKVWSGTWTQANISGPDYNITRADLAGPNGERRYQEFIRKYIPTINTLLATYPFLDRGTGELETANEGNFANHLVLDLNNGADLDSSRDGNVFLEQTKLVAIAGIHLGEGTPTTVRQRFGPADDVIAPFTDMFANDAEAGELFFEDVRVDEGGDGTVPLRSATGFFAADPRATVFIAYEGVNTAASAGHIKLTDNPEVQRLILTTIGAEARPENLVALGRNDVDNVTSIILDPVQGYLVDGQGRRLGWSEAGGPQEEIPNSIWYGDGDGFGVIYGPVAEPLRVELRGLDEPYYVQVTRRTADGRQGGVTLEGQFLGRGETLSAPVVLRGEAYLPLVQAGGPYTVAEGASVALSASGEAGLSYAWNLNGDGTFETAGAGASFSAAGVDGPASRTARVQGSLATGQSATAEATVRVENVAPTATLSVPATATAGQPFTLALTGASDAGGDPLQYAFDCGAGYGPLGAASSTNCTPTAAGTLTVRASVADDDGGVNTYTATVTVAAAPQPQPTQPEVALCYAQGAQSWQDFAQGKRRNGTAVPRPRSNPPLSLGLPQQNDTVNFVSLGFGGSLTLRFANPLVNDGTSKADLRIWETSFGDGNRPWSRYPEAARVEVSLDGRTWTEIGRTTDKDQAYNLILPRAQFVRLTDISDPRRFGPSDDGFDLDAIEALTGCVRP